VDNVLCISNKSATGKIHLSQIYVKQNKKTVIEMHSGLKQKAVFIVAVAILCNYYESLGYPPFFTILFTPLGFLAPEDYFLII
jgi:hypothetical protein